MLEKTVNTGFAGLLLLGVALSLALLPGSCSRHSPGMKPPPPALIVFLDSSTSDEDNAEVAIAVTFSNMTATRAVPDTLEINWGDGSPVQVVTEHPLWATGSSQLGEYSHRYAETGRFTISAVLECNLGVFTDTVDVNVGNGPAT